MEKVVTFGVAVYNVKDYLRGCLDSVIAQKGDDIEIIVVDDGSTDESAEICDEYGKNDCRIKVIHKENGGVSTARNAIIENASAEWICFIDGDDKLVADAADKIRKYANEELDFLCFDVQFFRFDKSIPQYLVKEPPLYIEGDEIIKFAEATFYPNSTTPKYINKKIHGVLSKVYRKSFLKENNILFDPCLRKSQDVAFSLTCVMYMKKAVLIRESFYLYRQNDKSIMHRYNPKITDFNTRIAKAYRQIALEYPENMRDAMMQRYYASCILIIKSAAGIDFCHAENPKPYNERKADFEAYIRGDWCREGIENVDVAMLNKSDRLVYDVIINGDFKALNRFYKKRNMDDRIRKLSGRLGLNKVRSRMRQKLKNK